jgi:nucleoside-diphosphate-sugar epimerase
VRGKKVLVIGGAGMVGSMLTLMLKDMGAEVSVFDDLSRGHAIIEGTKLYEFWDAGNVGECEWVFKLAEPEYIFNLAAYVAGIGYNRAHHAEMFEKNLRLMTAPVLAAKKFKIPHFLQVSSVCVYGDGYQNPCIESAIGGEPNPANEGYAFAKRMGERVALWANLPHLVIVRPANIYGVNDYFDDRAHVIPALIKKCLNDDVVKIFGTGDETREFIYSTDAARAMIQAIGRESGIYNIGRQDPISIRTLVYIIQEALKVDKPVEFTGVDGGDKFRCVNGDKLGKEWYKMPLAFGIETVCDWYKQCGKSA